MSAGFTPGVKMQQRFWAKVDISSDPEGCWLWQGCKPNGYGLFHIEGKNRGAHRVSYEMARGPIPDGLVLDHLCRNPACVNPDHLEPVTHQVNVDRVPKALFGANRHKTHCSRGHELAGDNIVMRGNKRVCILCRRARGRNQARVTKVRAQLAEALAINADLYEAAQCARIKLSRYRQYQGDSFIGGVVAEYEAAIAIIDAALRKAQGLAEASGDAL